MTKYASPLLVLAMLAGCPTDDEPKNGETLWLALDGSETRVRLVEGRPPPY